MDLPQEGRYNHRYLYKYLNTNDTKGRHLLKVQPPGTLSDSTRPEPRTGSVRGARVEWSA